MVRHWRGYIQNTWKYNKSNGVCEGYNNRIKVLKRTWYGLHNFESFRKRILLTCGPTQFVTNPAVLFQRNRTKKEALNYDQP
ncbi:MAG: transposase [Lachnospiraceae bacterium]